jgi:hypothetical protein
MKNTTGSGFFLKSSGFPKTILYTTFRTVSAFLKIHGARCGVEKGTQMGVFSEGKGEILSYWCKFSQ